MSGCRGGGCSGTGRARHGQNVKYNTRRGSGRKRRSGCGIVVVVVVAVLVEVVAGGCGCRRRGPVAVMAALCCCG